MLFALLISSFILVPFNEIALNIKIKGVESKNILEEGLKPAEFALMTIESRNKKVNVEKFDVILARDTRPVSAMQFISGNQFDLTKFSEQAKSGDRIVIEIKQLSGSDKLDELTFVSIPIK